MAFQGRARAKPAQAWQAWEAFLEQVEHLDGVRTGSTATRPSMVLGREDAAWAILPFGPARWMCLDWRAGAQPKEGPVMGYAVRSTREVDDWIQGLGGGRMTQGRRLAKELGWRIRV